MDDFEMLRVIGRGSYAKVLMVEQKRTKRVYAMKVIKKELVNDDEVSEIQKYYHTNSPCLIKVLMVRICTDGCYSSNL